MLTLAQLMGAILVLATFQLTVWVLPPDHVIPVAEGIVTTKGPLVAFTVTVVSSKQTPPPPARLSLAVNLKFIDRP